MSKTPTTHGTEPAKTDGKGLSRASWNLLILAVFVAGILLIAASRVGLAAPLNDSPVTPAGLAARADPAPAFTLLDTSGQPRSLADFRGQVVLINVWATWCPPCRAEMPTIQTVYAQRQPEGFAVLAVNQAEAPDAVASFMDAHGLSFPALLDRDGAVSRAYRANNLPSSFFVDRAGRLRVVYRGPLSRGVLESTVDLLLRERP